MGNLANSYATTVQSEQDAGKVLTINGGLQVLDDCINGRFAIVSTGGTKTLKGTPAIPEAQHIFLDISGALTSNLIVEIPVAAGTGRNRLYFVKNGTSGAFTVTIRAVGQTGVVITQGKKKWVLFNGTDIENGTTEI
jgi:hypothetical protein